MHTEDIRSIAVSTEELMYRSGMKSLSEMVKMEIQITGSRNMVIQLEDSPTDAAMN